MNLSESRAFGVSHHHHHIYGGESIIVVGSRSVVGKNGGDGLVVEGSVRWWCWW